MFVTRKKDNSQKIVMKHESYKSEQLASSLLKMPYTDEDTPSPISDVLTGKRPTMYFERYTKEFVVTTQEQGMWRENDSEQVITSKHYGRMRMTLSKHATSANAS